MSLPHGGALIVHSARLGGQRNIPSHAADPSPQLYLCWYVGEHYSLFKSDILTTEVFVAPIKKRGTNDCLPTNLTR